MHTLQSLREQYETQWEKIASRLVISAQEKLHLSAKKQMEAKNALTALLSGRTIQDRLAQALSILAKEILPRDHAQVYQEWEATMKLLMNGLEAKQPQQVLHAFSEETLEIFYQIGYSLQEKERLEDASSIFLLLCYVEPMRANIWIALGLIEMRCARIDTALLAFCFAAILLGDSPFCHLMIAECLYQQKNEEEAKIHLQEAKELLQKNPDQALQAQCQRLSQSLSMKKGG